MAGNRYLARKRSKSYSARITRSLEPGQELIILYEDDIFAEEWCTREIQEFFRNFTEITLGKASVKKLEPTLDTDDFCRPIYFVGADTSDRRARGFDLECIKLYKWYASIQTVEDPMCVIGYYNNEETAITAMNIFNDTYANTTVDVKSTSFIHIW